MVEKQALVNKQPLIEKQEFAEKLSIFLETDGLLPEGTTGEDFLEGLYQYIGDTDPIMRDDLVYPVFATLVSSDEYLSDDVVKEVLSHLLSDDYLHYQLGEKDTDSVFKRAFSALVLVPIIGRHREKPFLTEDEIRSVFNRSLELFKAEQDLRGYTEDKGWAHSNAHIADVFAELLEYEPLKNEFLQSILEGIVFKILQGAGPWTAEEDERLVTAIWRGFFTAPRIDSEWVQKWGEGVVSASKVATGMKRFYISINGKNFFRSLYFRGLQHHPESEVLEVLRDLQDQINRHLNY